jgi:hypothetical protein
MKKIIVFLSSFLITINAYPTSKAPCDTKKNCCCEKNENNYAFSYANKHKTECSKNIHLYGDFLYMNSFEDFKYAYLINKQPRKNHQEYKPGFRIGANTFKKRSLLMKNFYLDAQWKYLPFKRDSNVSFNDETVLGSFLPPNDLNFLPTASSLFKGNINTFDFRLIKPYCISRCYTASPAIGLRAVWIDQNYKTIYFIQNTKNTVKYKNDFSGIGLSASYDGLFEIYKYVNLYANTLFSLIFSESKISQHSYSDFSVLRYNVKEKLYTVNPNTEISLGLLFDCNYKNKGYKKVYLKLGYEFHYWWDQIHLKKFLSSNPVAIKNISRNDLLFNGFVLGLSASF